MLIKNCRIELSYLIFVILVIQVAVHSFRSAKVVLVLILRWLVLWASICHFLLRIGRLLLNNWLFIDELSLLILVWVSSLRLRTLVLQFDLQIVVFHELLPVIIFKQWVLVVTFSDWRGLLLLSVLCLVLE